MKAKSEVTKEADRIAIINLAVVTAFSAGINFLTIDAGEDTGLKLLTYGVIGLSINVVFLFLMGIFSFIRLKRKNSLSYIGSIIVSILAFVIITLLFSYVRGYGIYI